MKIDLKPSKRPAFLSEACQTVSWTKALPFFVNKRGKMTHRVRHVDTHNYRGEFSHHSVHYLCGNVSCFGGRKNADSYLTADPPADRLLCQGCEVVAARKQLPTADELAGRHVHRGVLVPKQTCCLAPAEPTAPPS